MSERPYTPLRVVGAAAKLIADELRQIAAGRALSELELQQRKTAEALATALLAARGTTVELAAFSDAFGRFASLFEAADIASRGGGIKAPADCTRGRLPITATHLAWYGVSGAVGLLAVIASRGTASDRRDQREILVKLNAALRTLAGNPQARTVLAEVDALFRSAGAVMNGEEGDAIVREACTALLNDAPAGSA